MLGSHKDIGTTLAMIVRNEKGNLLYLSSNLMSCDSPFDAELQVLEWVSDFAYSCGWRNIVWEVDAKEVVKEVLLNLWVGVLLIAF